MTEETGLWLVGDGVLGLWFDANLRGNPSETSLYTVPKFNFMRNQITIVQKFTSEARWMENLQSENSWTLNIWFPKML
jgi:hypothetical protein